ncbi:MAG: response regulator transcription factor [Cyclobacteriaceae bacterium]
MAKLRTFIIEDDIIHASSLEMLLDELGYLMVGSTDNSDDAPGLIAALNPDLLFVDIMINGKLDGIELVEKLQLRRSIPVIFITSLRTEDAIKRAMKVKPYAYILKPFEKATLQASIELAVARFVDPHGSELSSHSSWENDRAGVEHLFIKSGGILEKLDLTDIHYIEVRDKVCLLALAEEKREVRMPLGALEQKLPDNRFQRVHRSFAVNLNKITRIDWVNGVISIGQYQIPIGRSYRDALKARLDPLGL